MNINDLTLEEKIGQMFIFAFDGKTMNDDIKYRIDKLHVGGLIHFGRNIEDCFQACKLNYDIQTYSKIPLFIGIDHEGGVVQRITKGVTPFPQAMAVNASRCDIRKLCKQVGLDLKRMNFNMNFAPVCDVNNNPLNPVINTRSYSDNPNIVRDCCVSAFKGFEDANVLSVIKHFPGHGDTDVDSHASMPCVNKSIKSIEKCELIPFSSCIDEGVNAVMMGHIKFNQYDNIYPASLSKSIINDLLKEKMGFKGLVLSDSLTMGAIWKNYSKKEIITLCVNSGMDMLMFCGDAKLEDQTELYNILLNEVKVGNIKIERINESVSKILKYKEIYCDGLNDSYTLPSIKSEKYGKEVSLKSITNVVDNILLPLNYKNENILVIFPVIKLASLVDEKLNLVTLKEIFTKYKVPVDEVVVSNEFYDSISVENIEKYDKIIMATYNVTKGDYQTRLFDILPKEKTIVVSLRSCYDIMYLNGCESYICIYEPTILALNSLVRCMIGLEEFNGKLPVKIN